jgi:hypothetical protein
MPALALPALWELGKLLARRRKPTMAGHVTVEAH